LPFDRVEIRDITATNDDEFWGEFYTKSPSLSCGPGTIQIFEITSDPIQIGIRDDSRKPFSLFCPEGDFIYVRNSINDSFEMKSNPEGLAAQFSLVFVKDGIKEIGVEGDVNGGKQLFEYEIFGTMLCVSPVS